MKILRTSYLAIVFLGLSIAIYSSSLFSAPTPLDAGVWHSCGIQNDMTVSCWGANNKSQATPPSGAFTQVSAGGEHSCGIKADGTLACWGNNSNGQITPPSGTYTQLDAGFWHNCAVRTDGTLACWGWNRDGQSSPPTGTFTQVTTGYVHSCGLKTDGSIVCWGGNSFGQINAPSGTYSQLSSGYAHNCAIRTDASLDCWGWNNQGQLAFPLEAFTQISSGGAHSCGIQTNGSTVCWGENDKDGQATPPAGTFIQVSAGFRHSCGVHSDGSVVCWGWNYQGDDKTTLAGQATPSAGLILKTTGGTTSNTCSGNDALFKIDYLGACSYEQSDTFTLAQASYVTKIRLWYNTAVNSGNLNATLTKPDGSTLQQTTTKGGCYTSWCEGNLIINAVLPAGSYTVTTSNTPASVCRNPSGDSTIIVYGCPGGSTGTGTLPVDQWVNGFDISVDTSNVNIFLPPPTFTDNYFRLRRSYQPFGDNSPLDFQAAVLKAGVGSLRAEHLGIGGVQYWVDLAIDTFRPGLPLSVSGAGLTNPPSALPRWNGNFPSVDFTLTSVDIYGPPARIRYFDVGVEGKLYDVDFVPSSATEFVMSTLTEKGYLHFLPNRSSAKLAVSSPSKTPPSYNANGALDLPGVPFQSPLAIFGWTGGEGEQEVIINYASGSQSQRMIARDGVLVGTYSPPPSGTVSIMLAPKDRQLITKDIASWLRGPNLSERLNSCIDEKTKVQSGFKADNELSQQLVDLVFTIAGHDKLKLSNATLEKIRGVIGDSKDVVLEMMANGQVDSSTLGVFVTSTVLKNVTPEEHEHIVEAIWENKIPDHAKTSVTTLAPGAERNYKLAGEALADGLASTFFPAYTAAVKTVIQSAKYANDALADQAFQELYKAYKASNGNWDDVVTLSPLSTNKFASQKIKAILENQGKKSDDDAISAYLKNKMQSLYAQEQQAVKDREKLMRAKDEFMALSSSEKDLLKQRLGADITDCDLLQKYLDYVTRAQMDLVSYLGECKLLRPSKADIEKQAYFLAHSRLGYGTFKEREESYQKSKLSWLKTWDCLRYEDVRKNACSNVAKAGSNTPETVKVELGQTSGSFTFEYETYGVKDRMIVAYGSSILFDSGCVGTNGWKSASIPYNGKNSDVLVRVEPNCEGASDTQWLFKLSCPAGN